MKIHWSNMIILMGVLLLVFSCARPVSPNGGGKDKQAPKIITEGSSPNFSTNFNEREIELEFDEWVKIKNGVKNIVISPPTEYLLSQEMKGKKVIIKFHEDEVLKEDVTYQINFGDAIQDLTEGNALKDYRFVFATGDKLDSLEIKGKIIDAFTKEPMKEMDVYLYENLSDTVFRTSNPFYFTSTDETGNFKFQNIRPDTFQIFGLNKSGVQRYYTNPSEKIAFLDSTLILNDSSNYFINLIAFKEDVPCKLTDVEHDRYGMIKFAFSKKLRKTEIDMEGKLFEEIENDTIRLYYDTFEKDSLEIKIKNPDTSFYLQKIEKDTIGKFRIVENNLKKDISHLDSLYLKLNRPVASIAKDSFQLIDTINNAIWEEIFFKERTVYMIANMQVSSAYEVMILPNAIIDSKGKTNNDTLNFKFTTSPEDFLGKIRVSLKDYDEEKTYIAELLQKDEMVQSEIAQDSIFNFVDLESGDYRLRIIEDSNDNGYWDSGKLDEKLKPEEIFYFNLEKLKQGWDLETTISLKGL